MLKTKNKLFAAAAMLMVSIIMLTSASFAWFTISTSPEIKSMTTQVVVNQNLEIALAKGATVPAASATGDTGTAYTYGNLVDLSTATDIGTAYSALDKTLRPASLSTNFLIPEYGTDGRIKTDLIKLQATAQTAGVGNLTDASGLVYGYFVDFYMRSNVGGQVTLVKAAARSENGATGGGSTFTATGTSDADKALAKNIKLAFGTGSAAVLTEASATAATTTTADGATTAKFTGNVVNLTANTDTLVRMYVYLDGATVTNAFASINSSALINGALNIQFGISGVTDSMDKN